MLGRNLQAVYKECLSLYREVFNSSEKMFRDKIGTLSVFHKILIDRVADAYVRVAKIGDSDFSGATKDSVAASENLKKWIGVALSELHSTALETQSRARFYEQVVEVVEQFVLDVSVRKELLKNLRGLIET